MSAANGKNEISPCERKSFHLIDNGHRPLFVIDLSKIPVAHKEFVGHRGNPGQRFVGVINGLHFTIYNFYMKHDQVLKPLIKIVAGRHNTWSQLLKKAFKGGPEVKKKRDEN